MWVFLLEVIGELKRDFTFLIIAIRGTFMHMGGSFKIIQQFTSWAQPILKKTE